MTTLLIGMCLLMFAAVPSSAEAQAPASATVDIAARQQELLTLSRDKWTWMAQRNVDALAALFH